MTEVGPHSPALRKQTQDQLRNYYWYVGARKRPGEDDEMRNNRMLVTRAFRGATCRERWLTLSSVKYRAKDGGGDTRNIRRPTSAACSSFRG